MIADGSLIVQALVEDTDFSKRYQLLKKLGSGGASQVYQARQLEPDREVAIKIGISSSRDDLKRFRREARLLSSLDHPGVLRVFESEVFLSVPVLIMEYLEGISLSHHLNRVGALPTHEVVYILRNVLEGLAAVHDLGIIHRDLKAENLMLVDSGRAVKLLDFGLARDSKSVTAITGQYIVGTPAYMSPEQCRAEPLDHRTDLYSCGVLLYRMALGQIPFTAEHPMEVIDQHLHASVPSLRATRPDVPVELDDIVRRAMSKDRGDRYASAREFSRALGRVPLGSTEIPILSGEVQPELVTMQCGPARRGDTPRSMARASSREEAIGEPASVAPETASGPVVTEVTPGPRAVRGRPALVAGLAILALVSILGGAAISCRGSAPPVPAAAR